jgi:hypothetical protein
MGHGTGIEASGFGQLPSRFRQVPDLAGIHHHEGQGGRSQCRNPGPVVAARRLEPKQRGLQSVELNDEDRHPRLLVRDRPAVARGRRAMASCA